MLCGQIPGLTAGDPATRLHWDTLCVMLSLGAPQDSSSRQGPRWGGEGGKTHIDPSSSFCKAPRCGSAGPALPATQGATCAALLPRDTGDFRSRVPAGDLQETHVALGALAARRRGCHRSADKREAASHQRCPHSPSSAPGARFVCLPPAAGELTSGQGFSEINSGLVRWEVLPLALSRDNQSNSQVRAPGTWVISSSLFQLNSVTQTFLFVKLFNGQRVLRSLFGTHC